MLLDLERLPSILLDLGLFSTNESRRCYALGPGRRKHHHPAGRTARKRAGLVSLLPA
jgi:hypothetical protein